MQLMVYLDAAHLVLSKAHNRISGFFRLANDPDNKQRYMYIQ